jgi:opacity protein-like surface antigen
MRSVKSLIAAGAASLLSSMAFAADLPYAPPYVPPVEEFGGWYLRGDIGMTNQSFGSLHSQNIDFVNTNFPGSLQNHGFGFDSSTSFDLGVGYQFNNWLRADITGEYRGKANLHGSQSIPTNSAFALANDQVQVNNYTGSKSEWVFMANAYVDLGTWWGVTPFVGAGIGTARNTISGLRDDGFTAPNFGAVTGVSTFYGDDASKWNFAWALHAGLSYRVTPNVSLELAYRYISLGDGMTGATHPFDGPARASDPFILKDITSHDVKFGVRWELEAPAVYAPPPLIRKG